MHFVLSFPSRPKLSQKKLRKKIEKTLGFWREHYQFFWGMHCKITTKGTENYHIHVILNSVDFVTGNKLDISMDLRKKFQRYARRMWKDVEPK